MSLQGPSDLRIRGTHQMNEDTTVQEVSRISRSGNWQKFKTTRIMPPTANPTAATRRNGTHPPQPSLQVFSSNPIDYLDFVRVFEHQVERKTPTSSSQLYYLVQHTTGPVQELIKSCLSKREDERYQEARRLLKERYGQSSLS